MRKLGVLDYAVIICLTLFVAHAGAVTFSAIVSRVPPGAAANGAAKDVRLSRYGEQYVIPMTSGRYGMADEGTYFTAQTATPGTAYALTAAAQTAFSATASAVYTIRNNDGEDQERIYLDWIKIQPITAGTAATRIEIAVTIDNIARYSSGGTALTVYNPNMDAATATISTSVFAGAITSAAASGSVRYVCRGILKTAIPAVGDQYMVRFGADNLTPGIVGATHPPVANCPPAVLGGGDTLLAHIWLPSQSAAPTGEVSAGWWER